MPRTPNAYREPAANVPKVVYAITLGNILGTLDQYTPERVMGLRRRLLSKGRLVSWMEGLTEYGLSAANKKKRSL